MKMKKPKIPNKVKQVKLYSKPYITHLNNIILFVLLTLFIEITVIASNFITRYEHIETMININLIKTHIRDYDYICTIADCNCLINEDLQSGLVLSDGYLRVSTDYENYIFRNLKLFKTVNNIYISSDLDILLWSDKLKMFCVIDLNLVAGSYKFLGVAFPLELLIFAYFLVTIVSVERKSSLKNLSGLETVLMNKSMISIAENIHHELNTPLEVLDNKLIKLKDYIRRYSSKTDKDELKSVYDDFKFIENSSEQIYSVLEKMKDFKTLRYSNGNKNLEDIFLGAFKIIEINHSNFEFELDNELSMYSLKELSNAEFLSIIINHLKNSLEADSSKILVRLASIRGDIIKLLVIDNGVGIPKEIEKNLFDENFSSKSDETNQYIRGNGMYLNKLMLRDSKGNVRLKETSSKGTIIEIELRVNDYEKYL